jgi:hypothetical protein
MSKFLQTTHRDVAWFKQAHELHQLEMRPPFQRNPVWTDRQKGFLMDTMLNGYPIPEIYMQDIIDEKGDKKYIVVDGQQRITACLDFIYGHFSIDSKDSPSFGDLTFDDLTGDQKKLIYGYQFVIRILPAVSDPEIREIFQRLNRNNVALNPQELRQATYWGPFIETMNKLAGKDVWQKLDIFTSNDIKRMLDVEFVSELSIAVLHGVQNKKLTLDKYYELYEKEFPEQDRLIEIFDIVLRELVNILPDIGDTRWSKKTDFYTLFVLLAKHKTIFPLIETKRKIVREILVHFAEDIDIYVSVEIDKQEGDVEAASENVKQFGSNLRASSDLGARKKREEALENELRSALT